MRLRTLATFLIYIFLGINIIHAQNIIKGKVVDANKKVLAFVNIGIPNAGIGTISNDDGTFQLSVGANNLNDSLLIGHVGYISKKVCVKDIVNKDIEIGLSFSTQTLQSVTVISIQRKSKSYILGNSRSDGGIINFGTVYSGAQYALLIEDKKVKNNRSFPIYLNSVQIYINSNNSGKFKVRLNICERNSDTHFPDDDKIKISVVKEWDIKNGFLDYDLTEYQLLIDQPFFLVAELIQTDIDIKKIANIIRENNSITLGKIGQDSTNAKGENTNLAKSSPQNIPIAMFGMDIRKSAMKHYICYARKASFAKWEQVPTILTATATLSN